MATNRITIQLIGSIEDGGHVRLSAFLAQLEAVKAALKQTERLLTGEDDASVYYRVVDLRHSSPATVVLEAVAYTQGAVLSQRRKRMTAPWSDQSGATVQQFFRSLKQIRERRQRPPRTDLQALEAYRNLTATLDKSVSVKLINTQESVDIDTDFRSAIDEIIGPDELMDGSIYGMLERVNLHNTTRFDIYPSIGPKQVSCDFHPSLRDKVIISLDKYVCVSGKLRYKRLEDYPYAINADDIDILPDHEHLPSLIDLRGMVPNLTRGQDTDTFLEAIRDGENW